MSGQEAAVLDLVAMPSHLWRAYLDGYTTGLVHGIEEGIQRGRVLADGEASARFDRAVQVVRAMSRLDPLDLAQQKRHTRAAEVERNLRANGRPWPAETETESGAAS